MNEKSAPQPPNRCRLVLAVPGVVGIESDVVKALAAGDIASLILLPGEMAEGEYQEHVKRTVAASASYDVAVLVLNDTRAMGRADADGVMVGGDVEALKETVARFSPKKIVGYGPVKTRHQAMQAAEMQPDFLFVGKLGGDTHDEPHPKNLGLGEWMAEVMQVSSLVMAGASARSVVEVAKCGAEFAVVGRAAFDHPGGIGVAIEFMNGLLDTDAPKFDDEH